MNRTYWRSLAQIDDKWIGPWEPRETGANHPTMLRAWQRECWHGLVWIEEHATA